MKTKTFIAIFLSIISTGSFSQTAKEISKKSIDAIDVGNIEMISTINIRDAKGNKRVRQITTASKQFGGVTKMLIRFIAPADVKGTSILVYDYENESDNMWIYLPALRKVRRVVSSEKGKSFMGSEFTNADMSKPNTEDFDYNIIGTEMYEGKSCWKIETTSKTEAIANENGFKKRISYTDKSNYVSYKVEYYDAEGKLRRIQTLSNYKKQPNGKYFAYYMSMESVQSGRKSEMIIDKLQSGSQLPESAFAPTALEK
ncbi:MAG TPA: outer membrane lipoprotein-sorting protein [Paludibacter sp.]|nr:outer membrane lipoprotein-sorting protein [Paludibacter sp.]